MFGEPNTRDHSACKHPITGRVTMPRIAETVPGSRNKSSKVIELLFSFSDLLSEDGNFYDVMVTKGIGLVEGDDYRILDKDGNVTQLKTANVKVGAIMVRVIAEQLNVPTTVRATSGSSWIEFRPNMSSPFADDTARREYLETRPDPTFTTNVEVEVNA